MVVTFKSSMYNAIDGVTSYYMTFSNIVEEDILLVWASFYFGLSLPIVSKQYAGIYNMPSLANPYYHPK